MAGLGRAIAVAVVTLGCVAYWSTDVLAVGLPTTTTSPLPNGSTFQGADGNQGIPAPPPALTDWETLAAQPGRVVSVADAESPDTRFSGGNDENTPGNWDIISPGEVSPEHSNIQHAWYAVKESGTPPNVFLYTAEGGGHVVPRRRAQPRSRAVEQRAFRHPVPHHRRRAGRLRDRGAPHRRRRSVGRRLSPTRAPAALAREASRPPRTWWRMSTCGPPGTAPRSTISCPEAERRSRPSSSARRR